MLSEESDVPNATQSPSCRQALGMKHKRAEVISTLECLQEFSVNFFLIDILCLLYKYVTRLQRHQKLMKDDQAAWWNILSRLQIMLRRAAQMLHEAGQMSRETMHSYFMSGIANTIDQFSPVLAY